MIPLSDLLNPVDECPLSFKRAGSQSDLPGPGFTKHLSSSSAYRHDEVMDMEYFAAPNREAQRLSIPSPSGSSLDTAMDLEGNLHDTVTPGYLSPRALPLGRAPLLFPASDFKDTERESAEPPTGTTYPSTPSFRMVRSRLDGEDTDPVSQRPCRAPSIVSAPIFSATRKEHAQRYLIQCPVYRCTDCSWTGHKDVERRLHFWNAHNPPVTALLNAVPPIARSPSSSTRTTPTSSDHTSDVEARQRAVETTLALPVVKVEDHEPTLSRRFDDRTCPICRTVVSRRHDLKRHMRRHDPNAQKYECPEEGCGYANLQRSNLKFHILAVHPREKLHELAQSIRETRRFDLRQDDSEITYLTLLTKSPTLSHSPESSGAPSVSKGGASRKKRTLAVPSDPCPECGKVMNRQADLKRHMVIHNKSARGLKCQVDGCQYSTNQSNSFRIHMNGHSGTQPWSCPETGCNFRTNDPASLLRHRKRKHGYIPVRRRGTALFKFTQPPT